MIYEVCVLVATIVLGVLGLELILWVRSIRKLTDEAKQTIQAVNTHLPSMIDDVQVLTSIVRQTTEQVGGTVNEVAVGLEDLRQHPLRFVTVFLVAAKQVIELWNEIRGREKEASDR